MTTQRIESVPSDLPFEEGQIIHGKVRIERLIGHGGMALVYEATHLGLAERVAIKVLRPRYLQHGEVVARFEREARVNAKIKSEHVVRIYDIDRTPSGLPYIVMELLDGRDLETELLLRGSLPIEEAVGWVMEACIPISEVHALGIVHRDLKPGNLFIAKQGERRILKLLDFGIAKVSEAKSMDIRDVKLTSAHAAMGTPYYMSPEQIRAASEVDGRADIWSLGVLLYELLTGALPFSGTPVAALSAVMVDAIRPPSELRSDIPAALETVMLRALEKDREKRFSDVLSFALALSPFARAKYFHTVRAHMPSRPPAPRHPVAFELRTPRRSRHTWMLVVLVLAGALLALYARAQLTS